MITASQHTDNEISGFQYFIKSTKGDVPVILVCIATGYSVYNGSNGIKQNLCYKIPNHRNQHYMTFTDILQTNSVLIGHQ